MNIAGFPWQATETEKACQLLSRFTMQPKKVGDGKPSSSNQRAQLTRLILNLERDEQRLAEPGSLTIRDASPWISAEKNHLANPWHAIGSGGLALSIIFILLLALTWMRRDFKPVELPQWRPVFALAEVAREKGELYDAKGLYSQAGTFAAARDDWRGLLAAACGIDRLEKKAVRYSGRESLLLRAMAAAEKKQSRAGITSVAEAFALLGEHELASVALSRVRKDWATENSESADVFSDCWKSEPHQDD